MKVIFAFEIPVNSIIDKLKGITLHWILTFTSQVTITRFVLLTYNISSYKKKLKSN